MAATTAAATTAAAFTAVLSMFVTVVVIAVMAAAAATTATATATAASGGFGQIVRDYRIYADDKIRYHGDDVAVVVAETREIAIQAAQLVKVNAEPLPAVLDPEAAMLPDSPLVHENHGSNIVNTHVVRRGNVLVSFGLGALIFKEKNIRHKAFALIGIIVGIILIGLG